MRGTVLKVPLPASRGKQSSHSVLCKESVKHWNTQRHFDISPTRFKYRNTADNSQFSLTQRKVLKGQNAVYKIQLVRHQKTKIIYALYRTSGVMTLRIEFDITRPLCVLLISCSLFNGMADHVIVSMHENLLLLPASEP